MPTGGVRCAKQTSILLELPAAPSMPWVPTYATVAEPDVAGITDLELEEGGVLGGGNEGGVCGWV